MSRQSECERSANGAAVVGLAAERVCAAAHRLHKTHDAWARTASDPNPGECYQCHVFARIVIKADDDARISEPS